MSYNKTRTITNIPYKLVFKELIYLKVRHSTLLNVWENCYKVLWVFAAMLELAIVKHHS